jgi:phosphotriesterase-related protein
VNYLFEDLIPDLREAGIDEATITKLFVENPADFLTIQN